MKLTLCNEVVRDLDFPAQCAFARAVGYDGLEIAPFTLGDEPHRLPAASRAEARRVAADHGIAITGLHYVLLMPAGLSITSGDAATRARTLDVMEGLCGLCADLGGRYLVHGSPAQRQLDPADPEGGRARGEEAFLRAAEFAAAAGVTYIAEPLGRDQTPFLNTVAEGAALAGRAVAPSLRTMLDCCSGGTAESEPLDAVLDRWLPTGLVAHIHVNDPNRRGPGQGDMDFAPIVAALKRNGYGGAIGVEPFDYVPDGPASAARAAGYMRALMETVG